MSQLTTNRLVAAALRQIDQKQIDQKFSEFRGVLVLWFLCWFLEVYISKS